MASTTVHGKAAEGLIQAALRDALTQAQAQRLYELGSEVVTMALLAAAKHIVEQNTRFAEQDARIAELEGNGRGA